MSLKTTLIALASLTYRRTHVYLAKFEREFGEEFIPRYFRFEIDGYKVISLMADASGYAPGYSDIPGLTECWWILYSEWAEIAETNDENGVTPSAHINAFKNSISHSG